MEPAQYRELLRPLFTGRKVVCVGEMTAHFTPTAALALSLGAESVLVIGTGGYGMGSQPEGAAVIALDPAPAGSMLDGIRYHLALMHNPPPRVQEALRSFDPDRSALVLGTFLNTADQIDGRPLLAYRHPEWLALEDKTLADGLWGQAGVARAPAHVGEGTAAEVRRAAAALDEGQGTVWAGDASEGFNGGAEYVRWVSDRDDEELATTFLATHCTTARVMPFLEGVPCSIHGIVFHDHVAALRPVEMVTLRRPAGHPHGSFFYAGCSSFYDPPAAVRAQMQAVARSVGATLLAKVGFRGAFTVDGVVTRDGFLPTELNPRMGAGLNTMMKGIPDLPLQLLLDVIVAGIALGYEPCELERDLLAAADAVRSGGTWRLLPGAALVPVADLPLRFDNHRWSGATDTQRHATVSISTSTEGAFVRATFNPDSTPVGRSVGQRAVSFWRYVDESLGSSIGPLTSATPVD